MKKILSLALGLLIAFAASATIPPDPVKSHSENQVIAIASIAQEPVTILVQALELDYVCTDVTATEFVSIASVDTAIVVVNAAPAENVLKGLNLFPAERQADRWHTLVRIWRLPASQS